MTTSSPSTSDHILSSSNTIEATEMFQKLSLGSPNKSLPVADSTGEKPSVPVPYVPVERSVSPFVDPNVFYHHNASFTPDFVDPTLFYNPSGYPSHTYYYGGNEWDRYVSPDGAEMAQSVYGDYSHSYSYMPYGTYPSGATMGHDAHLYEAQHYQYPASYVHPSTVTSGANTSSLPKTGQVEVSTSGGSNPLHLPVDTANGNQGIVENVMTSRTNLSKTFSSTYQNPSMTSNDFYGSGGFLPASSGISPTVPYGNYRPSRKNQNPRPSNGMDFRSTRVTSGMEQGGYKAYTNNRMYYENTHGGAPGYMSSSYYPSINNRGWLTIDNKYKSRSRSNDVFGYSKETLYGLNELNKGPRTNGANNQNASEQATLALKDQSLPLRENNEAKLPIFPDREQCNKDDFPETYSDARFFVIKSYSEDDVHKSIKYGVWTSTASGNKKLDAAYKEAKERSGGCPVFLLFSVNASGQFVGLAEMVGPIEFDKTVEYWQQDKWNGCFPVKWHIIKDVPNSLLRHIKLENNENKPVTNSRDAQEVRFEQGIQVLKIFKSHSSKTCILNDFKFYEGREKVLLEKKARHLLSNKQGLVSAANAGKQRRTGIQPSNEPSHLSSDLTEDTIALVSSGSEMEKVIGEPKLLRENSPGARVGDTSVSVQAETQKNKQVGISNVS